MKRFKLITFIFFISINICRCEILNVPSEYSSIQEAINSSKNNDTVLVAEGRYFENISFKGKGIVVTSNYIFTRDWQTVLNTIIDGSTALNKDSASVVRFLNSEDSTAVLEGFTITGGSGTNYKFDSGSRYQEGGGIILSRSSAVIRNNLICGNGIKPVPGVSDGGGGGIASMYGNPTIINNVIASNNAGYAGGIVLNWSGGKIRNNIIYHNTGRAPYGTGGVMLWVCPANFAFLENNTIISNISLKDAGGININTTSNVIKNNIVWGNCQTAGGQILNAHLGSFNNIEDYSSGDNISVNPKLIENSFSLQDSSPCIDAGDPSINYNDIEDQENPGNALQPSQGNLTNDIGAFGGAFAKSLPLLDIYDLYTAKKSESVSCNVFEEKSIKFPILNLSSRKIRMDSIAHQDTTDFQVDYPDELLDLFQTDTLTVIFKPALEGIKTDTITIFYGNSVDPLKIILKGTAIVAGVEKEPGLHLNYELYQNFPNPFNPSTTISYNLSRTSAVEITIYDILGKQVKTFSIPSQSAGRKEIYWNGTDKNNEKAASGIYLCHFKAVSLENTNEVFEKTAKLLLLK